MVWRRNFCRIGTRRLWVACVLSASLLWSPLVQSQSLDLPLDYYATGPSNLKLVVNIGIGDQPPQRYSFDTGSDAFVAEYVTTGLVFGSIPGIANGVQQPTSIFPNGLPTNVNKMYGDGVSATGNLVGIPSVTFYPTLTATSGIQIIAQTPGGAPSAFIVNAVNYLDSPNTGFNGPITKTLEPFFGQAYGDFGAGDNVTPQGSSQFGSILGQAVVPGTSAGYVVAANGASLMAIGQIANTTFPAAAYANGPQGTHDVTPCGPCVILGLTPALVAQFQPQNTLQWTSTGVPFWNSGNPSSIHHGVQVNYSVTGSSPVPSGQTPTLFDTGNPAPVILDPSLHGSPTLSTVTYSGPASGALQITDTVVPNSPYAFTIVKSMQGSGGGSNFGLEFFLQNSVLYNLAGQEIAYTPNFVTNVDITTTPANPLVISSASVPLGLAGNITGSGGVTITSDGSATLSGANAYTGATRVRGRLPRPRGAGNHFGVQRGRYDAGGLVRYFRGGRDLSRSDDAGRGDDPVAVRRFPPVSYGSAAASSFCPTRAEPSPDRLPARAD